MLTALLIVVARPQGNPVARFENYMKGAKTLSVDLEFSASGSTAKGSGSFHLKRPGMVLFKMKMGKSDYSFSIGPQTSIAIERANKHYREYGQIGRLFLPDLDISETPEHSFPLAVMAGSLNAAVPAGVKFSFSGKSQVDGVPVDQGTASYQTQTGKVIVRVKVDMQGRAREIQKEFIGGGSFIVTTKLSNYRMNPPLADTLFELPPPVGFVPQTLPADSVPLNVGEKMPFAGWHKLGTSQNSVSLPSGKPLFVAIWRPECEVSKLAAPAVSELARQIQTKGGAAVSISLSPQAGQKALYDGLPSYFDSKGNLASMLRAPGTPLFLLVTSKGFVSRVWYGFDPEKSAEFKQDVLEWLNTPLPGG